jgi:hypothetical protein
VRGLWAVLGATSILIAACTSSPTVSQSNRSTAVCFDSAKVKGLYDEWAQEAADTNLSDGMDMALVVASLRSTREIASKLALATAADTVAAEHFKDAADALPEGAPDPASRFPRRYVPQRHRQAQDGYRRGRLRDVCRDRCAE